MTWMALVPPRLGTEDDPGMCLRFSQSFFGAPVRYRSAWEAWQNQTYRHPPSDPLPNVPVLLWYSHWGTYGRPLSYENWGHVTPYVPGDAIYSSPDNPWAGWSQSRFSTIAEVERAFNCKYVGWSEDINGLRVAEPEPATGKPSKRKKRKNKSMIIVYYGNAAPKDEKFTGRWAVTGANYWVEMASQAEVNNIAKQLGIENALVCKKAGGWNKYKNAAKK